MEYVSEALALLSVCAVWWPAFKIPHVLRFVSKMRERKQASAPSETGADVFSDVWEALAEEERKRLDEWSPLDHWLLVIGLVFAAGSSAIKLFYLLPTAPTS